MVTSAGDRIAGLVASTDMSSLPVVCSAAGASAGSGTYGDQVAIITGQATGIPDHSTGGLGTQSESYDHAQAMGNDVHLEAMSCGAEDLPVYVSHQIVL
jgi:hypothetical protein